MPSLAHNTDWVQLRHHLFAEYPTTLRRSVYLGHGVVIRSCTLIIDVVLIGQFLDARKQPLWVFLFDGRSGVQLE